MMTKEVASIVKYCNDNGVNYKARLSELGVPETFLPSANILLFLFRKTKNFVILRNRNEKR